MGSWKPPIWREGVKGWDGGLNKREWKRKKEKKTMKHDEELDGMVGFEATSAEQTGSLLFFSPGLKKFGRETFIIQ